MLIVRLGECQWPFPDQIGVGLFGRLALFLGWAAIILGILIIGLPTSVAIATGCLFGLYLILYFATDLMKKFGGNDSTPADFGT